MVKGKKILVIGLANKYSIAAAIATSLHENGAILGFSYQNDRFEKKQDLGLRGPSFSKMFG